MTERLCEWCGEPFAWSARDRARSYCSRRCTLAALHARNWAQMKRPARPQPTGPAGCTTIEEWLARGGTITRCPTPAYLDGPMPVRSKARRIGNPFGADGKVR